MTVEAPPTLDLSALENSGLLILNRDQPSPPERTLIVLGLARSGTTMVAGALHHLGVDVGMGAKPNAVYEDVALSQAMEERDEQELIRLIRQRNDAHAVWGWKRPSALMHIERIERHFRNPHYVVLFRDIFAIANRNRISVRSDLLRNMTQSVEEYLQLIGFLQRCRRPALLISYEKAMLQPMRFAHTLADFAGVEDRGSIREARRFVRRNSGEYLVSSRNWGGVGYLDRVESRFVSGWALLRDSQDPVSVDVWINSAHAGRVLANRLRKDLIAKLHPTGECGFRLDLPESSPLREGDVVRVRIVGDARDLNGSPRRFAVQEMPTAVVRAHHR